MSTLDLTLGWLRDDFLEWLAREVAAGRTAARTVDYYRDQLGLLVERLGGERRLDTLTAWDLEGHKGGWHQVQAGKRLLSWAVSPRKVLVSSPWEDVDLPEPGSRQRVLARWELARLLARTTRPFRLFLVAMRHTLARPQEIRALRWGDLDPTGAFFCLREFKGRRRRRERVAVRLILLDGWMQRLLARWQARRRPDPAEHVFANRRGEAWTANAIRCAMRRARVRAGLDQGDEPVVCYTLRHTAATEATRNGVLDRQLADLMGHASTRTTARYQHLPPDHLREAIVQATRRRV